jgi:transposase InsO family protein
MDYHQNARLTVLSREQMAKRVVEQGCTLKAAAAAFNVSAKTASKWATRYRTAGAAGLRDRSSRPCRLRRLTPGHLIDTVVGLRHQRWAGCRIASHTGLSPATVSRILRRLRLNRIRDLEPAPVPQRYEHEAPGDLIHLDIKKLGRFSAVGARIHGDMSRRTRGLGWDYVHVAIDDHSRIAFAQILPRENGACAVAFLQNAIAYYQGLGIPVRRLLTDNGPCYRSREMARACSSNDIGHRFTRPYTPRTNGKAERFIQTAIREWAYARAYNCSQQRAEYLYPWLHDYNWHRPHASLNKNPPISRSGLNRNNLLMHHTYSLLPTSLLPTPLLRN